MFSFVFWNNWDVIRKTFWQSDKELQGHFLYYLVVVTTPVDLPACWAQLRAELTWLLLLLPARQSPFLTSAVTPMVAMLAFTPPRYAVALQAESATWLFTQYVCGNTDMIIKTYINHIVKSGCD